MLIEFYKDQPNIIEIFFYFNDESLNILHKKLGVIQSDIPIKIHNKTVILYKLDTNALFYTTKKKAIYTASTIKNKWVNICINLENVDEKYKLLIIQLFAKQLYSFTKYKKEKKVINLLINDRKTKAVNDIINQVHITNINRNFQNEPSNVIYPETFCKYAKKILGTNSHLKIDIVSDTDLQKQGFNLVYNIGKSSVNRPKFMMIYYKSNPNNKTVCLIGKGVTFDLGGANIKLTSPNLFEMKTDKAGGCTVIATIKYIMENNIKLNIVGLIPLVDNLISADMLKPGDIIKSYNGKSVEVLDVDAEGRLILADAFGFAETLPHVDYIINLCTLTGAAEHFHCDTSAIYLTFNKQLANVIEKLSECVGERVIALPPWKEYLELVDSNVADAKNLFFECKKADTFMAAMFLLKFVPKRLHDKWIHFDITHFYNGHVANGNITILLLNLLKEISEM